MIRLIKSRIPIWRLLLLHPSGAGLTRLEWSTAEERLVASGKWQVARAAEATRVARLPLVACVFIDFSRNAMRNGLFLLLLFLLFY